MKNFSKLLVLFILFVGIISYNAFADSYQEVFARLNALGIMTGDIDGFRENDPIKRSEFAAVIVRALGIEDVAKAGFEQTEFKDVPSDHWAVGYIAIAYHNGIVNGIGDGMFAPDEDVTYEQAVKMIVCALGYEPAAIGMGGYPSGYLAVAADKRITNNAGGFYGKAASRGTVAILIDNSLDVPLMIQSGYGDEITFIKSGLNGTEEKTLLGSRLNLKKYRITVLSFKKGIITGKIIKADDSNEIGEIVTYDLAEGVSRVVKENETLTVWVREETIFNFETKTESIYDFVYSVNGSEDASALFNANSIEHISFYSDDLLYYVKTDSTGKPNAPIKINGSHNIDTARPLVGCLAMAMLEDDRIISMDLYDLEEGGIIKQVTPNSLIYDFKSIKNVSLLELEEAKNILVIVNGELLDYTDLYPDMVFDYWSDGDNLIIVASDIKVSGVLDGVSSEDVVIGDRVCELSRVFDIYYLQEAGGSYQRYDRNIIGKDPLVEMLSSQIQAYIDSRGEIRYLKANPQNTEFYGIVLGASDIGLGNNRLLKIYNFEKDEQIVYKVREKRLEGNVSFEQIDKSDVNDNDYTEGKVDIQNIFKFTTNEKGEIDSINAAEFVNSTAYSVDFIYDFGEPAVTLSGTKTFVYGDFKFISLLDKNGELNPSQLSYNQLKGFSTIPGMPEDGRLMTHITKDRPDSKYAVLMTPFTYFMKNNSTQCGFVTKVSKTISDSDEVYDEVYKVDVQTKSDLNTYKFDADKLNGLKKDMFVFFYDKTTGYDYMGQSVRIYNQIDLSDTPDNWVEPVRAVNGSIYEIEGSTVYFTDNPENGFKIAVEHIMVYEVSRAGNQNKFALRSLADAVRANTIWYVMDGTRIVLMLFER